MILDLIMFAGGPGLDVERGMTCIFMWCSPLWLMHGFMLASNEQTGEGCTPFSLTDG